jgi:predicted ribosome quality control (RQC) complex YloA/Tae2 family protein
MELGYLRNEIEHMRRQIARQRKEIKDLERAGISTKSALELLERMQNKVDGLCLERDRQVYEKRVKYAGTNKVINGPIERRFR